MLNVDNMSLEELRQALLEENKKVKLLKVQLDHKDKENRQLHEECARVGQLVLQMRQCARELLMVGERG